MTKPTSTNHLLSILNQLCPILNKIGLFGTVVFFLNICSLIFKKTTYKLLMKRLLITLLVSFSITTSLAADFFWIGGSGDWSDPLHWSATTGGPAGAVTPIFGDNAIFDAASGLTGGDVNFDTNIDIDTLDFSGVIGAFNFSSSSFEPAIHIQGSLISNGFATFSWGGIIEMIPIVNQTITSAAQLWTNDFQFTGAGQILLNDDLVSTSDLIIDEGGINSGGFILEVTDFIAALGNVKAFNFDNSSITLNGTSWTVEPTSTTFSALNSTITIAGAASYIFNGGGFTYNDLNSSSDDLTINGANSFTVLDINPSSTLTIEDGATLTTSTFITAGDCSAPTTIQSIAGASISITGIPTFTASYLMVDNIAAVGPTVYEIAISDTINGSTGWTMTSTDFYWVGGDGVWSDGNHWALTSGGIPSGCVPGVPDNVFIDALSIAVPAPYIIDMDVPVTIQSLDYSLAVDLTVTSALLSIELQGSLSANGLTVLGWNGDINMNPSSSQTIMSDGTTWDNDFHFIGSSDITLVDAFFNASDIYVDSGDVVSNGQDITTANFYSNTTGTRNIDFNNSNVTVTNTNWDIDGTNLTWSSSPSAINLTNIAASNFIGGAQVYDTVYSLGTQLLVSDDNTFTLLSLIESAQLTLENGSIQTTDSLITNGVCGNQFIIESVDPLLASASISKTGFGTFTATNLAINNVDAIAPATYGLQLSDTTNNASGWEFDGIEMYWIGNTGDWNDGANWSLTSGGTALNCIPTSADSVYFDAASFNAAGHTVTVDDTAYFGYMNWTGIVNSQTFQLESDLMGYGDVVLNSNLNVTRNIVNQSFVFNKASSLTPNSAIIDANFVLRTPSGTDALALVNDLVMSDTSSVVLFNGTFNTQNQFMKTGSFRTINDPTVSVDNRTFNMGSSFIHLKIEFSSYGDTNLVINPGTSHLYIGDTVQYLPDTLSLFNNLTTQGALGNEATFNEVTLNFQKIDLTQSVLGHNTFNILRVVPGSSVSFQGSAIQTVSDSLILQGNCRDSIKVFANLFYGPTSTLNNTGATTIAECLYIDDIITSTSTTALFSTNLSAPSLNNWVFDTSDPVTANFTAVGPYCFGDSTEFTNNSVNYLGNSDDITSVWYFNDGSTGYYANPPTDSTFITYEADTSIHIFLQHDSTNVILQSTYKNFCTSYDTVKIDIILPNISLLTSKPDTNICPGIPVTFEAYSGVNITQFEFFYNGVSQNTPSINDTIFSLPFLNDDDSISVLAYESGCVSQVMPLYVYNVYDAPLYTWSSDDADTSICIFDNVNFEAHSADSVYEYQFFVNNIPATLYQDSVGMFSTSALLDNDLVYVVGRDSLGCKDTLSMVFNVDPLPVTVLSESSGGSVICENQSVTFTGSGADQYEFYINGAIEQTLSTTSTWTTTSLAIGDTVSLLGMNNNGCLQYANETFAYIVNSLPSTSLAFSDLDTTICSGEEVIFTASGAVQYQFFINGTSQGALSPTTVLTSTTLSDNDTIHVVGLAGGCTFSSDDIIMEVLTSPTTILTDDDANNTICYGENVNFTATGATNYEFFVNGVSQGPASGTGTFSTTGLINGQTVSVIGESNTCTISQQSTWIVLNNPNVNLFSTSGTNVICMGDPITFTGSNASQYNFLIDGVTVQGPSSNATLVNPAFTAGVNEVQVVGTAGNGCTDSSTVIFVTANAIPTITSTSSDIDNIICAGESVTFTGNGGDMYQFYINGTPQGALTNNNTFTTASLTNGQVLTIQGQLLGCPNTSNSITTTVNPVPSVTLNSTDNVFCIDETVVYTATGATNYQFFVDGISQGASSAINTINSTGFVPGTYPVQVIGETNGCMNSTSLTVTVNSLPTATITSSSPTNTICSGNFVTYTGTGGSLFEFFVNGSSQGSPSPSNTFNSNTLTSGDVVSLEVSGATGCSDTDTFAPITVNLTPTTVLTSSDANNEFCIGDNITFTGNGATEYQFFLNGVSQGPASTTATFSSSTLANGANIQVVGSSLGCFNSSSTISNIVFGLPVVTVVNNNELEVCVGENLDLVASGATNYQFLVNGTPTAPFSSTNTFNGIVNNGDVVTISGETNGCPNLSGDVFTYTVYNYPTLVSTSSDANNEICIDENVVFNANGGMTYDFSLNGNSISNGLTNTYNTSDLQDGDIISITAFNGDCPSSVDSYTFVVNSMPLTFTVSPSTIICNGEAVTFTGAGGDNYEFFLNGVSTAPLSASSTYITSTLVDGDEVSMNVESTTTGCIQVFNDYILMNVIDEPTISPLSSITFCEGDSVILVSNALYGNQWLLNGIAIPGATDTSLTVFDSGAYSLETTSGGTGTIWSFGQNAYGSFSSGNNLNNSEPTSSISTQIFDEISSGYEFVLGVNDLNEVYAWGENSSGQLGNGTYTNSNQAQLVPTLTNIKTVATSQSSSMAVDLTGAVYVWGNNTQGQLGTGNTAVINFPFLNATLTNVDSIAGGKTHFIILRNDGTVAAVGNNDYGQLGQNNLTGSNIPLTIPGLANIVSVGAGEYHSFAIDSNGDLFVWGNNGSGQLGLNDLNNRLIPTLSPLKNTVNAQGGATHSAFVTSNGKVYTSGGNAYGQLGTGTFSNVLNPTEVNISGAKTISTGQYTTLVQRNDNSVFGFGNNTEDQLSSSTGLLVNTPEHISDLDGVTFIEAGKTSSHFIYGTNQSCISVDVNTVMNVVPVITITESSDVLSTITGASYQWYFEGNMIPGSTAQSHTANASGNYSVQITFANGCIGFSDEFFHGMANLSEMSIGTIQLYPNPTRDNLNLSIENAIGSNLSVSIVDQTGRLIQNSVFNIDQLITIDVLDLESGVYYLQLSDERGNTETLKFIKTRD